MGRGTGNKDAVEVPPGGRETGQHAAVPAGAGPGNGTVNAGCSNLRRGSIRERTTSVRDLFLIIHDVKEKDMNTMFEGIKRFAREEDGAAGIEYALLLAFVALCMVAAGPAIETAVTTIWTRIQTALTAAST
ncbi:hypothetical protein LMG32289_04336 [Cupriavidus pampae]|nr:hypothetical protein LMG32289_04336 [Cupriavidus pampae]